MNYSNPSSPDIMSFYSMSWDDFVLFTTKTQRRDLRLLASWFIPQGIRPSTLSQAAFERAYDTCLSGTVHRYNQNQVRYLLNGFATIFNNIVSNYPTISHVLNKIPGPQEIQRQKKIDFRNRFEVCLTRYAQKRADYKGVATVKIGSVEENGLYNCINAASSKGIYVDVLEDILIGHTITSIMDWCDESGTVRRSIEMMTVIAQLATNAKDIKVRKRVVEKARALRSPKALTALKMHTLVRYVGNERFSRLVKGIQNTVHLHKDFKVNSIKAINPYVSSVSALIIIFAPITIGVLYAARFNGTMRKGVFGMRPTLAVANGMDNIEDPLSEGLVRCIDNIFEKYRAISEKPESLFIDINGFNRKRILVTTSIELIIKRIDNSLTVHDLRDVGIVQLLKQQETMIVIANASRLSLTSVEDRFGTLQAAVSTYKRG